MAIAIWKPLLKTVNGEPAMTVTVEVDGVKHSDERPDVCSCSPLFKDLPC